ncbi:alpha/beta-hydrolase [Pseudovirgaria hyperparasitica]|uniref:Alpha/beta-hydrolase n=1 Tax=Pseudovirgaria hyperparasitica TaxID=470096 RepID=A0A6A6WFT5_9PEZI|nr:alpha/beta-hydrolase [Pseudovirgaria hyperparasitica]KAF2760776.1 alpha/beta-hydrolase [Pseudovirgaria hyperparasitica]
MDASNPACEHCIQGTIHTGQPTGSEASLHDLNVYIANPPSGTTPKAIIVIYTDVFGLPLPNNKLIADAYARAGYQVYMPDFFKGDPVALDIADVLLPVDAGAQCALRKYTGMLAKGPSFVMWMTRHGEKKTNEVCMAWLRKLRAATPASTKIGMVGFCWGGKYAIRAGLAANRVAVDGRGEVPLVDAVVALHPSHLAVPGDVEGLVVPVSYGWGLKDEGVSIATKGKVEDVHAGLRAKGSKVPEMEHRVYEPGRHGFAVRGNPDDPQERKALEDSEKQALEWMDKHL